MLHEAFMYYKSVKHDLLLNSSVSKALPYDAPVVNISFVIKRVYTYIFSK